MKKSLLVCLYSCAILFSTAQTTSFSEVFNQFIAPTTQCTNWNIWRSTLDSCYTQVTLSSTEGCSETCSDAAIVAQIITALKDSVDGSWSCGGKEWFVEYDQSFGKVFIGVCISSGCTPLSCGESEIAIRPCIANANWGGCAPSDCNAPTQTLTVTFTGGFTFTSSVTDVQCFGDVTGTATITPTSGNSPYTYQWDANANNQTTQTATGLGAGTYVVIVADNNGCGISDTITIIEPPQLTSTTDSTNLLCNGDSNGTATVTPAGGTSPYTYLWDANTGNQTDSTATGLSGGTYTVTVTDDSTCVTVVSVAVFEPTAVTAGSDSVQALCNGDSNATVTITPSGGASPYTYLWDNNTGNQTDSTATGLPAGTYFVTVTDDNGCTYIDSVMATEPPALSATISANNDNGNCDGDATANPTGGTTPYSYAWGANTGNQTTQTASGLCTGYYCVTITDNNGCTTEVCDSVKLSIGINSVTSIPKVRVYPNPSTGKFYVEFLNGNPEGFAVEISNVIGQSLMRMDNIQTNRISLDITEYKSGLYLLNIWKGDRKMETFRILKK